MGHIVAFFSYARSDDNASDGRLKLIHKALQLRLRSTLGDSTLIVFMDQDTIEHGENWDNRLKNALSEAEYFIPIITPNYFLSKRCIEELNFFRKKEIRENDESKILPIRWIPGRSLVHQSNEADEAYNFINSKQIRDWSKLNLSNTSENEIKGKTQKLADMLSKRMRNNGYYLKIKYDADGYGNEIDSSGSSLVNYILILFILMFLFSVFI